MKRAAVIVFALLLGAFAARRAEAHIVPIGVGTQTWIEVRPRKVIVRFNLGFSSLIGLGEFRTADTNHDRRISNEEERAYLEGLGERVLPKLRFMLDGKPLALRLLHSAGAGMVGPIIDVGFDTFFDLEADVALGAGPHELSYYEGTYENEVSQQILYIVTERADDYKSFDPEQPTPSLAPPQEADGATMFMGRDVDLKFEFMPKALERDRAEALIESSMAGLQASVDAIATTVARSAESDLAALSVGEVRFGVAQASLLKSQRRGFAVSAPTFAERTGATSARSKLQTTDTEETRKMLAKVQEPFTLLALAFFMAWGALHALMPGHGKTMVAAYLLGTKGRLLDAARLGLIVTFTHTFVVYTLGLGLVYLVHRLGGSQDAIYQRTFFLLKLGSGLVLCFFGLGLAWRRRGAFTRTGHDHEHGHDHAHEHAPAAVPATLAAPAAGKRLALVAAAPIEVVTAPHDHGHGPHTHTHDGLDAHEHSHEGLSEDEHAALHAREAATEITSLKDLLTLGISGGIVPCPAGVTLILTSIAWEISPLKVFLYLNAFSVGLGGVLVAIALFMVVSRSFLVGSLTERKKGIIDRLPVLSAIVVACIGLGIAYEAYDPNFTRARERLAAAVSTSPAAKTMR